MGKLIDSDQPEAIGLTLGSPRSVQPDLGFEFRFSRARDSVGYMSAASEAYSVYNVRLDIRPIQIRLPLYQYKQERPVVRRSAGTRLTYLPYRQASRPGLQCCTICSIKSLSREE